MSVAARGSLRSLQLYGRRLSSMLIAFGGTVVAASEATAVGQTGTSTTMSRKRLNHGEHRRIKLDARRGLRYSANRAVLLSERLDEESAR